MSNEQFQNPQNVPDVPVAPSTQIAPLPTGTPPVPKNKKDVLLGFYGLASSFGLDQSRFAKALYDAPHFNGVVVHGMGACWQNGCYPYLESSPGMFDLTKRNPDYFNALDSLVAWLKFYGLKIHFRFFDRYCENKFQYNWINNKHPYRKNNLNWNVGNNIRQLANNDAGGSPMWLLANGNEKRPQGFTLNKYGNAVKLYVSGVIDIFKKHGIKFYYSMYNEIECEIDSTGHCVQSRSYGDDGMQAIWLEYLMNQAGLKRHVDYTQTNDFEPFEHLSGQVPYWQGWKNSHDCVLGTNICGRMIEGYKEIHHGNRQMMNDCAAHGFVKGKLVRSFDGEPENIGYFAEAKEGIHSCESGEFPVFDCKYYVGPGQPWHPLDISFCFFHNWQHFLGLLV